ncbi:MAG: IS5 family transposase [Candidatus Hydrogenedentes bacterium]|nr:IS5 family transposase [Candidatus Hydrogenedentota bacterium]
MARAILPEELWTLVEPLLPPDKPLKSNGRPAVANRDALTGILFVLRTGIPWEYLPQEMGCGCGMTCWRRLSKWQELGVWQRVYEVMLARLHKADRIDWSRVVVDSSSVRAVFGGKQTGPNPTDRRKLGTKHHLVTDGQGIPLAFTVTGANRHDVTQLVALIDAIPPVRGKVGRPKRRPRYVVADRAYHSAPHEVELSDRGIGAFIARRKSSHGSGLGILRWVVERTISWLHQFRRLRVRYERRVDIHEAFLALGCVCICFNFVNDFC